MAQTSIEVIAITPVKSGGVLRVPGTNTERFEVSLETYQALKILKAVRAASDQPEETAAAVDSDGMQAKLTEVLQALESAVAENDALKSAVALLEEEKAVLLTDKAELQTKLDLAEKALATQGEAGTDSKATQADAAAAPAAAKGGNGGKATRSA